jgi:hypothetical protein
MFHVPIYRIYRSVGFLYRTNLNVCKLCISCRACDKWTPVSHAELSLGLSATETSTAIYRAKIMDELRTRWWFHQCLKCPSKTKNVKMIPGEL